MAKRKPSYKRRARSRKDSPVEDIPKIITGGDYNFEIESKFKLTPTHRSFVELCYSKDTNIAFVDGPAGTAKTYCAAYLALNLLKGYRVDEIIYIRSIRFYI